MKKMCNIFGHKENVNQNDTEILPHSNQNGYHQQHKQQQIPVRMWGKGTLIHCWWKYKLVKPLQKVIWWFLKT
jgi:hypothetical protein